MTFFCAIEDAGRPGKGRCVNQCASCASQAEKPERDSAYEAVWFDKVAETADRRFGLPVGGFVENVQRRLALGEERYAGAFMRKDAAPRALDVLEEAWDAAAYAAMDAQVRLAQGVDDAASWRLFEIAVHAAAIHAHACQLRAGTDEA